MRAELRRTLCGAPDEVAKGKVGLLRKMREDGSGDLVRCPCRNQATTEPDRDFFCRYCHGMGYFWDEHKIVYYKRPKPATQAEIILGLTTGNYPDEWKVYVDHLLSSRKLK